MVNWSTEEELPKKGNYAQIQLEAVEVNDVNELAENYDESHTDYGTPLKAEVAREFGYIFISYSNFSKNVIENRRKQFKFVRIGSPEASAKTSHPFYKEYPDYIRTFYHEAGSGFIDAHIYQVLSNKRLHKHRDQLGLPIDVEF
jgi:hypothetical protein